jgi:hypothetical protein
MYRLLGIAAAGLILLGNGARAQAQHHHVHFHHDHIHLHNHGHYFGHYYSYPGYTVVGGTTAYGTPLVVTSPSVVVYQSPGSTGILPAGATSLRSNPLPPYTGPGVSLRLPAEFTGSVYVRIDKRDIELRPGMEVQLRDKGSYLVEFDQGGGFGAYSGAVGEGSYRFAVGSRGWQLLPDAPADGPRPNLLPTQPKS